MNNLTVKNDIDLGIVTYEPFPIGMAATNRFISYSKEICKKYKKVKVYIAKPTEIDNDISNFESEGSYNDIKFKYVHNKTVWIKGQSKLKKIIIILNGIYLLFVNLKKDRPKSIILVSNNLLLMISMWLASKLYKFNYFLEKSEYPIPEQLNKNYYYQKFYFLRYRLFDGTLVMTKELQKFFNNIGQKNQFHLPMSVDFIKFSNLEKTSSNKYFAYCGGGNYERDGLFNIVKAFIRISDKYPNYELIIIGPINNNNGYFKKIQTEISEKSTKQIKFIGKVSSAKVPQWIVNAECLIMTPQKDFTSGGFPTKLGEYLSTGNPVICTNVSEIPYYLDKSSAILIDPKDDLLIYNAIEFVINNPIECKSIGIMGQKVVQNNFEVKKYIDSLIKYLKL
jgi:glycosyltransferase involved in cell wall biosynthesis